MHLLHTREGIILRYTSLPKVYRVFILEDEYIFMTRDILFLKKTSPQVATNISSICQDPELDLELTPQDQGYKDTSPTTSVDPKILAEDIVFDED
jgi:hypothetical protein